MKKKLLKKITETRSGFIQKKQGFEGNAAWILWMTRPSALAAGGLGPHKGNLQLFLNQDAPLPQEIIISIVFRPDSRTKRQDSSDRFIYEIWLGLRVVLTTNGSTKS